MVFGKLPQFDRDLRAAKPGCCGTSEWFGVGWAYHGCPPATTQCYVAGGGGVVPGGGRDQDQGQLRRGAVGRLLAEEVWARVRAADEEQGPPIFLTAAFAGLRRGEIVALCWRDFDFAKRALRAETSVVHGRVD